MTSQTTLPIFDPSKEELILRYAEQEFALAEETKGVSLRQQLLSVERQTGKTPPQLANLVELPYDLVHIWQWFVELHNARQSGYGTNPLSYTEILAYFTLLDIQPEDWEVKIIKGLDSVYMKQARKEQEKQMKSTGTK